LCPELKRRGDSEVRDGRSASVSSPFTFVKLGTGRHREISPLIWVLSVLFLLRYAFLSAE
jgi:xanthine/uracil/vitamin C permease (AzgA family)